MWQTSTDLWPDSSVAPTLYGLGETMTAWAHRALAGAGRGRLIVVGCSIGASCALEMARIAAARIDALVLVGGKAGVRYEPSARERYVALLRDRGVDAMWDEIRGPVGAVARRLARDQTVDDLARGVRAFHTRPDAATVLRDFDGPVHIVHGALDGVGAAGRAAAMAASTRDGHAHLVEGAGHYVNLDRPEAFNELLVPLMRDG
jgi:pimeloyl-ACP methyl ester carboxylesterase